VRLPSWLTPPAADDAERALQATVIHWVLVTGLLVVGGLTALVPVTEDDYGWPLALYSGSLTLIVACLVLLHQGFVRAAAAGLSVGGLGVTLWACLVAGGVGSPQLSMGVLVIMMTGITWSSRAAIWMALATSVSLLGLEWLRGEGMAPDLETEATPFAIWASLTSVLALSAVFVHFFVQAMRAARDEAASKSRRLEEEMRRREEVEDSLTRAQKLEALGRLTGGIAHDFNNILTVLLADSELLQDHARTGRPLSDEQVEQIEEIRASSERAAGLTAQLLAFARQSAGTPESVGLDATVEKLEPLLSRLIRENVQIAIALDAPRSAVRIDVGQLERVILNLVLNARDAMPEGGELTVVTRRTDVETPEPGASPPGVSGPHVVLEVSDQGAGIAPDHLDQIFDPFFSTKAVGQGTGLGLSSVHGIVAQAGGHIAVASEVGRGTTFRVYLPEVRLEPAAGPAGRAPRGDERRGTILLVEDNESVRRVTLRILESAGYAVLEAAGPLAALQLLERHEGEVDLLLTDVVMPDMDGRDLAQRVAASHPGIRVLLFSGYTPEEIANRGSRPSFELVQKPFTADELLGRIAALLSRPGEAPE
jgi:signal transduction histidine kinase/CheY-like chemotaxis protein